MSEAACHRAWAAWVSMRVRRGAWAPQGAIDGGSGLPCGTVLDVGVVFRHGWGAVPGRLLDDGRGGPRRRVEADPCMPEAVEPHDGGLPQPPPLLPPGLEAAFPEVPLDPPGDGVCLP